MDFFSVKYIYKLLVFIRYHWKFLLVLVSIAFLLFAFCTKTFAYSESDGWRISGGYNNLGSSYNYKTVYPALSSNSILESIQSTITSHSYYATGKYYYFIGYQYDNYGGYGGSQYTPRPFGVLIEKTLLDEQTNLSPKFVLSAYTNYYYGNVIMAYLNFYSGFTDKLSQFKNFHTYGWYKDSFVWDDIFVGKSNITYNNTQGFAFICQNFNSSTNTTNLPFITDIPYQILYESVSGTNIIFEGSQNPYLANTDFEMQTLATTVNVVPQSAVKVSLSLTNRSTDTELFSVDLADFSEYVRRIDLEDPFSPLAYMIPIDKLPSFSYTYGQDFDWIITYGIGNTYPYRIHFYVTSQYQGDNPVGGGVSPRFWWRW